MKSVAERGEPKEVEARLGKDEMLTIPKCPFCGKPHYHGKGYGHRSAHCVGGGPDEGYVLVPMKD